MRQHNFSIDQLEQIKPILLKSSMVAEVSAAASILVQIFTGRNDAAWLQGVAAEIQLCMPCAVIVGTTTIGEVLDGRTLVQSTVVAISIFDQAVLQTIACDCKSGNELQVGARMAAEALSDGPAAGLLLLSTSLSFDVATLLAGLTAACPSVLVFGGGAGDYAPMRNSLVSCGSQVFSQGAVAVVLRGPDLVIQAHTYLGWQPLSRPMTITSAEGTLVRTVDHLPAFEVYRRYLNVKPDSGFFLNALEFPFLVERGAITLARVPVAVEGDGALRFVADIQEGEVFRLGYGNPSVIIADADSILEEIASFCPEAIFLYTCGCRRFLLQDEADLETGPFQRLAPTVGFYTYGEFLGHGGERHLLNSTMVAVAIREGGPSHAPATKEVEPTASLDPYQFKHARIISQLMHFIGAVTAELEILSTTDALTQINNRLKLDKVLVEETTRSARYGSELSVILIDLDHFKRVNDVHGHHAGDRVLVHLAEVVRNCLRQTDIFGRWGGEEFLVILPHISLAQAIQTAEKIRSAIEECVFPFVLHGTASLGVSSFRSGETSDALLCRADEALYQAKADGRNRVRASG